ncbi:MAG: polymerase factor sigma-54 [Candidatus Midichloriaceae bacterium]|nr:polymerase factor sigma-54 [Candidatus Midichloriaceae bacterium]
MLDQKLSQKASQTLIVSKQMQQSLKILQMSSSDLSEYLENEIQDNPFVELETSQEQLSIVVEQGSDEIDTSNYWQDEDYLRYNVANSNHTTSDENIESHKISLKEHILEQANICFIQEKDKFIASYLTDLLDQNGYLKESIDVMAQTLKCQKHAIEAVLQKLKTFDPIGVFASDIAECLTIQLREQGVIDKKIYDLVANLDMIAKGHFEKLIKQLKINHETFATYMKIIRSLDPKPARNFNYEFTRSKIADAFIYKNQNGEFAARLNPAAFPTIFVNSKYFEQVYQHAKSTEEKKFCSNKLQIANWLLRSVTQRAETILRVVTKLSEVQHEFLTSGLDYLKPMTLSDLSKMLDLHESTISRISNKYVGTPFGVFEIKYFFSNALSSNISENLISTRSVKSKIEKLIEAESETKKILSDDEIAKLLTESGINISRRTVAKYRDMLGINPSHLRKKRFL